MPETNAILRRARPDDLPGIVRLLAADTRGRLFEQYADPLPESYRRAFAEIDADPHCLLLVAELDGRVVGTLQVNYLRNLSHQGGRRALVESMHVDEAYRNRGIGGQMLSWTIAGARQAGCHLVQLTSHTSRQDAHRFYQRLGFVPSHVGMKLDLTRQPG